MVDPYYNSVIDITHYTFLSTNAVIPNNSETWYTLQDYFQLYLAVLSIGVKNDQIMNGISEIHNTFEKRSLIRDIVV